MPESENSDTVENPSTLEVVTSSAGAAVPIGTMAVELNGFGIGIVSVVESE